jgi:hypothetical protein
MSYEFVIRSTGCNNIHMFRAIGTVIVLYYLSTLFAQSFHAADKAISASFHALEATAVVSQKQIEHY